MYRTEAPHARIAMQAHPRRSASANRPDRPAIETAPPTAAIELPDDQRKAFAGLVDETAQRACAAAGAQPGPIQYAADVFGATDAAAGAA
jgi:hypothetical protein